MGLRYLSPEAHLSFKKPHFLDFGPLGRYALWLYHSYIQVLARIKRLNELIIFLYFIFLNKVIQCK